MSLGKRPRPRPPMKRTTSMSEISFDLNTCTSSEDGTAPRFDPHICTTQNQNLGFGGQQYLDQRSLAATTVSPGNHRRACADFLETAHFLRTCSLCKRRLVPGRDIYMYRGDSAFCSLECRQQQMNQDERTEKCSLASKIEVGASSTATSEVATKNETVAAV